MKSNHRLLFVMYRGAGILSLSLFLAIPLFHIELANWMNVHVPTTNNHLVCECVCALETDETKSCVVR